MVCACAIATLAGLTSSCVAPGAARADRVRITVLDAQRVEIDGELASWADADRRVRKRVQDARASEGKRPSVALNAVFGVEAREMNRMVELLGAAGVREIDFGPIRR